MTKTSKATSTGRRGDGPYGRVAGPSPAQQTWFDKMLASKQPAGGSPPQTAQK